MCNKCLNIFESSHAEILHSLLSQEKKFRWHRQGGVSGVVKKHTQSNTKHMNHVRLAADPKKKLNRIITK